jgi:ABC-type dipeptide/oligopeptide/nickel transport system permease subunit
MATVDAGALELQWVRKRPSAWKNLARLARKKYLGTFGAVIIVFLVLTAIFGPMLAPYDPIGVNTDIALQAPTAAHPFGTDELGRDILSRIIHGSRVSLTVSLGAVGISVVLGIFVGLTSAYFGGKYDIIMQRIMDGLLAFPSLVLAMVIVATLGSSLANVILAIAIHPIATRSRVLRGTALSIMQNQYVDAARAIGSSNERIMLQHVLPNCWAPMIVLVSIALGTAILAESSLSFLGLGPPPPNPTWGSMLSGSARTYMSTAPWMAIAPGAAITLVVLSFNLLGDALRDILDPRLRGSQ